MPPLKTLTAGQPPERHHVPIKQPGITFKRDAGAEFGLRGAEHDGFLRQPFQRRACGHVQLNRLIGRACCAVPLGCAGAGQLRPGIGPHVHVDVQLVAARNPARWVDDDVLTHLGAFGVQVLLHPQGAEVTAQGGARAITKTAIAQRQLGVPAGGEQCSVGGQVHG